MAVAERTLTAVGDDGGSRPAVGDVVETSVRSVATGGAGVAELPDGRIAFVHRTAPGDRARVRITALKPTWGRGELVELLEPGPARRDAPCPHYDRCGGCTLEHLTYPGQLRWKGRIVADALGRIGGIDGVEAPEVVASPRELRYRNRVSFHLRRLRGGRVVAGFHRLERPGRIVDVGADCLLPEEPLARAWGDLRAAWGPSAGLLPPGPSLRLTLRSVVDGALLLVEPGEPGGSGSSGARAQADGGTDGHDLAAGARDGARRLVASVDGLRAVWWRGGPGAAPVLLAGTADTEEVWRGRRVRLGPTAFLQVNREAAEALHEAVLAELDAGHAAGRRFVDGYCGVGAYGRRLAEAGATVVGIELDAAAAEAAERDAPEGFRVLRGRVEERLEEALPADAGVLNPPRTGLHDAVPAVLAEHGPARLVYVSCDPPTLARDLARLDGAYRLGRLRAFDLFPQTAHVETVATLERRE